MARMVHAAARRHTGTAADGRNGGFRGRMQTDARMDIVAKNRPALLQGGWFQLVF